MIWGSVGAGMIIGLVGSFHCVAMCGPLNTYVYQVGKTNLKMLIYTGARISTYILLGFIVQRLGNAVNFFGYQQILSIVIGIWLISLIIFPKIPIFKNSFSLIPITKAKQYLLGRQNNSIFKYAVFGLFNGLLPCGLVYVALSTSMVAYDTQSAILIMMGFGIGTSPVLGLTLYAINHMPVRWHRYWQKSLSAITITVGILLLVRGLALDIPYISPAFAKLAYDIGIATCG